MTDTTEQQAVTVTRDDALAFADEAFRNRDITFSHRDVVDMVGALGTFLSRQRLASVSSASADYVLVPREPTQDQLIAGNGMFHTGEVPLNIYRAMLAASPEPVPATNQAGEVATAVELLEQYAGFIRDEVKADDLERHPYLPLIEQTVEGLTSQLMSTKSRMEELASAIEPILFRAVLQDKVTGYTLLLSQEIARVALNAQPAMSQGGEITQAVERMRDDPFLDDLHLMGTTQQDERMAHYATKALAAYVTPGNAVTRALTLARDLIEVIEQTSGNVWFVNADDPETAVCVTSAAIDAAIATQPATSQEGEAVVGDRVRIRDDVRRFGGRIGTVERFHEESISQCPIELRLDDGSSYCFRANEIERLAATPTPPTLSAQDLQEAWDRVDSLPAIEFKQAEADEILAALARAQVKAS